MKCFSVFFFSVITCAAQQAEKKIQEKYESMTPYGNYFLAKQRINPITTRMGLLDKNGKIRIPFHYDGIEPSGDQAVVFMIKNKRYVMGVVSLSNDIIIPVNYFDLEPIHQCYAAKDSRDKFGVFSKEGVNLTGMELDSVRRSAHYILLYKEKKAGLMSGAGKMLLPIEYANIELGKNIALQKPPSWFIISEIGQKTLGIEDDIIPCAGSYIIRVGNKWGARDSTHQLLPVSYAGITSCGKNFMVKTKTGWSFFDSKLQRFQEQKYDAVSARDTPIVFTHFWGMLDEKGNEILPCIYDSIGEKRGDFVLVKMRNEYGLITTAGKWVEMPKPSARWINNELYACSDGVTTWVKKLNGKIIRTTTSNITPFDNYFREVDANGAQTDFDFTGQALRTDVAANKWIGVCSEGLQSVCNDRRFGFTNKNNQMVIGNRYEDVKPFSEGLAAVKVRYWGFINKHDKFVVQPTYDSVGHFQNHLCIVSRDRKWGIVSNKGAQVLALGYDKIIRGEDCFLLINKHRIGLANARGEVVIAPRFDSLQPFSTLCIAEQNKKFGLISKTGMSVTPIIYEKIIYNSFQRNFLAKKRGERTEIPLFP